VLAKPVNTKEITIRGSEMEFIFAKCLHCVERSVPNKIGILYDENS